MMLIKRFVCLTGVLWLSAAAMAVAQTTVDPHPSRPGETPFAIQWTDRSGRVALDVSNVGWFIDTAPRTVEAVIAVVHLPPGLHGDNVTPDMMCIVRQHTTTLQETQITQGLANEYVRRTPVPGSGTPPEDVREHDGVLSAYMRTQVSDATEQVSRRLVRYFAVPGVASVEWYFINCLALPEAGPDAEAAMLGIADRFTVLSPP